MSLKNEFVLSSNDESDYSSFSDSLIKDSFKKFLEKPNSYKKRFLQSEYNCAFDGYSFFGQEDSLNQYASDMLHSFVMSDFQSIDAFPKEFHAFLETEWQEITQLIKQQEIQMLEAMGLEELIQLYNDDVLAYMMSCNYYPKPSTLKLDSESEKRLSSHKDASMFTTFPFGVEKGLRAVNEPLNNQILNFGHSSVTFQGYFLELVSNGRFTANEHYVELQKDVDQERFSFAFFSLPKPGARFMLNGKETTSEVYYSQYLNLF